MKVKIEEKQLAVFILTTGLVLNYIVDGVNKVCSIYLPILSRSAIIYRALLQILCIVIIVLFVNKKRVSWLLSFLFFLACFFISNLYLKYIVGIDVYLIEQFIYFNKYFFIFFLFFATYKVLAESSYLEKFIEVFKKVFLFNGFLALVGALLSIKAFFIVPEGPSASRFGYDGLIISGNEASIFYLLGLFVIYKDWRFKKRGFNFFLLAIVFCFLTGMKAVLLGMALLFFYHLFTTISIKKLIGIFSLMSAMFLTLFLYAPKIRDLFGYYFYFLKEKGFVFMFTGGRNTLIDSRVLPFLENWDIINYLIGGQNISNIEDFLSLTEMDIIDLFLFFGVINGVLFLLLYKTQIVSKVKNTFYLFCVGVFILLAFFAGHFFTSSVNPIYIIVAFAYLNENTDGIIRKT
ncbi:hypothetical protein [Flagellimonas sp. CMM7]|uniref:hypothetical protein n=1 Tax=Flagellimonas sp. CMM7 TaxID=2654676 RepID=UPI0013D3BA51|nr:hypothetical protein [Flagellimonas sp. CMM7]UII81564.1 hypothetical protein LV704_08605 [Flagellimonas sp. CMM7]